MILDVIFSTKFSFRNVSNQLEMKWRKYRIFMKHTK